MATRTGAIGNNDPNNYQTAFKTPVYTGITMETGEYPTKITLNDLVAGGPQWRNNHYSYNLALWLDLCDADGNNKIRIWTATINKQSSNYTKEFTVPDGQALAGKALYLIMEDTIANDGWDTRDYTVLRYRTAVTVETAYNNFSIYGIGGQGGDWSVNKTTAAPGETITYTAVPSAGYSAAAPTSSPAVTMTSAGTNKWTFVMPNGDIQITPHFNKIRYTISRTVTPSGGGTLTTNKNTGQIGDEVTITATPAVGYRLVGLATSPNRTITNNKFTMPASNVTVTATFEKITYAITPQSAPTGAGTVTLSRNTATYGDTVTVSQTPAEGYYFDGWETTPAGLIPSGSNQFTMPAQAVTVKAKYLKRSTATASNKNLTSNENFELTITPDKAEYRHKYRLYFGTGMDSGWVTVNANTTKVTISVPDSWADAIPNTTSKSGGTLQVKTYKSDNSTEIGTYTISGFVYNVRDGIVPTLSAITTSIVRTIGGTTYANVGNYYVQGKSGVRVEATAAGARSSTISKIELSLSGYSGSSYNTTVNNPANNKLDFTTGLLNIKGEITITVKATDSRGRTVTKTTKITVTEYNKPSGTLQVWRVDSGGVADVFGTYAQYKITTSYTQIGSGQQANTLTVTLKSQNSTASNPANTGNLLPTSRQTFDRLTEYQIQLVLQDKFETVTITTKLTTAQFMLFFNAAGDRMALMKAANESLSKNGKAAVVEISEDAQVYLGQKRIEQLFMPLALNKNSVSSLPTTISDSRITSTMICKPGGMRLSNPGAQRSDWTITTSNGSVTISGTISGSTNIWLWLEEPMT